MLEGIGKGGKRWMKVFNFIMEEGDAALCLMWQLSTIDLEMRGETKSGDDLRVSWNTDDLQLLFINLKRYWQDAVAWRRNKVKFWLLFTMDWRTINRLHARRVGIMPKGCCTWYRLGIKGVGSWHLVLVVLWSNHNPCSNWITWSVQCHALTSLGNGRFPKQEWRKWHYWGCQS